MYFWKVSNYKLDDNVFLCTSSDVRRKQLPAYTDGLHFGKVKLLKQWRQNLDLIVPLASYNRLNGPGRTSANIWSWQQVSSKSVCPGCRGTEVDRGRQQHLDTNPLICARKESQRAALIRSSGFKSLIHFGQIQSLMVKYCFIAHVRKSVPPTQFAVVFYTCIKYL